MRLQNITIDCDDPYPLVGFWAKVTDLAEDPENRNEPGDPEGLLVGPRPGPNLLFIKVPETSGANRLRLDLTPTDRSRDEEVERLLSLGATLVADHRQTDGEGWVLLADPEGNEFSVARRLADSSAHVATPATVGAPLLAAAAPQAAATTRPSWLRLPTGRPRGVGSATPFARVLARELRGRLAQLVRLALLLVEALIALRILLKVAGANPQAAFANLLYKVTSPLVGPFHPVFADHPVGGHPFEVGSLLAMAVYAAAAYVVLRLMRVFFASR